MTLTERQLKLVRLLFEQDEADLTAHASTLCVSPKTIERDMQLIYETLNLKPKNKVGIIKQAIKKGWIKVEELLNN